MKYDAEQIGKNIKIEREQRGWSQVKLGEKLHISGKQISTYESGSLPPLDNLLNLCNLFDCELGYLLGEEDYAKGTKLETLIYDVTGLTNESTKALEYICSPKSRFHFGHESESFRKILNSIITSESFINLMDALHSLNERNLSIQALDDKLKSTFEDSILQEAHDLYTSSTDYEHSTTIPPLSPEVVAAINMISDTIDKHIKLSYSIKVARYELNEAFVILINEMFGNYTTPHLF